MAVDTRNKRFSLVNLHFGWARVRPHPDGDINNADDRTHMLWLYSGLAPDSIALVPGTANVFTGGGQISFTSSGSGRSIINPPLLDQEGGYWRPSISNDGVITLTSSAEVVEGELFAAFQDDADVLWLWQIDPCDQAEATTLVITNITPHRVSVKCTFSTGATTDLPFRIYSIRPYLKALHSDDLFGHEAVVEARIARPSVKVSHTGGPFVIDAIAMRLKPLKNQVKG